MAFTLQDDTGTVVGANAYIDVAAVKAYHKDRGNEVSGGTSEIQTAIVRATDYIDERFSFVGTALTDLQATAWPRADVVNSDGDCLKGVPDVVKDACAEYTLISLNGTLNPTPITDDSGSKIQRKREKVGPIEEETEFTTGAAFRLPKYPTADLKLRRAGVLVRTGKAIRG